MITHSVRERIVAEITRRAAAGELANINYERVQRTEVPEDYDASHGSVLAVLEGAEALDVNARGRDNKFTLFLSFAVPLAAGEVGQTVANDEAARIVGALHGDKSFEEGGDGTGGAMLQANVKGMSIVPDLVQQNADCAAATVEFSVHYRTAIRDMFALA